MTERERERESDLRVTLGAGGSRLQERLGVPGRVCRDDDDADATHTGDDAHAVNHNGDDDDDYQANAVYVNGDDEDDDIR